MLARVVSVLASNSETSEMNAQNCARFVCKFATSGKVALLLVIHRE
jgi:hypothetical protein